jgi:predicted phosphodiesterase
MKIAVISDIHGNDLAFAAVLADFRRDGIDQIVCCGDAIQGGAQPAEVVRRLRELACPVVMGNADDFLLNGDAPESPEPATPWQLAVRDWQLTKLSAADRAFIAGFATTIEVELPNGKRLIAGHGSPRDFNHVILPEVPDEVVRGYLGPVEHAIVCGGHTHLQQIRQLEENFFFNPGSVSLPARPDSPEGARRASPWAEYAVLTVEASGRETLEFRRVPFDVERLLGLIRGSGMPQAERLAGFYQL